MKAVISKGSGMSSRCFATGAMALMLALCLGLACCERTSELLPLPPVDTSAFEPAVQAAFTKARADVERATAAHEPNPKLAAAYGELAMRYHVHDVAAGLLLGFGVTIALALIAARSRRTPAPPA